MSGPATDREWTAYLLGFEAGKEAAYSSYAAEFDADATLAGKAAARHRLSLDAMAGKPWPGDHSGGPVPTW